jgi:hypothetical protein
LGDRSIRPARAALELRQMSIGQGDHPSSQEAARIERRFILPQFARTSLTLRLSVLVVIAVLPAILIQGYNEYDLRKAREADIRQQIIQITRQFGEEIGELREGARQLLIALAQLGSVRLRHTGSCNNLFASLKSKYENYGLLAAADKNGQIFCSSVPLTYSSVTNQSFFKRATAHDGLAVGNYWVDPASNQKLIHFAVRFDDAELQPAGASSSPASIWLGFRTTSARGDCRRPPRS